MFYSFDYNPNTLYKWKCKSSFEKLRDSKQINSKISPSLRWTKKRTMKFYMIKVILLLEGTVTAGFC